MNRQQPEAPGDARIDPHAEPSARRPALRCSISGERITGSTARGGRLSDTPRADERASPEAKPRLSFSRFPPALHAARRPATPPGLNECPHREHRRDSGRHGYQYVPGVDTQRQKSSHDHEDCDAAGASALQRTANCILSLLVAEACRHPAEYAPGRIPAEGNGTRAESACRL